MLNSICHSQLRKLFAIHYEIEKHPEVQHELQTEDMSNAFSEQLLLDVEDIDEDDLGNPTLCAEYVKDIYRYMHQLEVFIYLIFI